MPCITISVDKSREKLMGNRGVSLMAKLMGNRGASLTAKLAGNRGASFAAKLAGNRGVSLVEMLLCVLILTLSTGVIVSTLDLGIRHFQARTRESEQRLLCNTLSLAVQNHLTYANQIKTDADGNLTEFKTGAISALEGRWFEFVTGTYSKEGGKERCSKVTPGQIALEYSDSSGEKQYYHLADKSQYIVKRSAPDDVSLGAELDVKVDKERKRFNVTITVTNADGGTKDAENQFIVIPINLGVIPDPPAP